VYAERHEVITTEKVPFSYHVAGLGSRFLAWLVDAVGLLMLVFAGSLSTPVFEALRPGVGQAFFAMWFFVVSSGYFFLFEWLWHGQTPGKWLLGLRVIDVKGTSVGMYASLVRNIVRMGDSAPFIGFPWGGYPFGFLVAATNAKQRRPGDLAAGTLVVHTDRQPRLIRALQAAAGEGLPLSDAVVRQRLASLTRPQKQVILDLCLRREQLRLSDRVQLFRAVADYLKAECDLQPGEHQSDEKFVLQLGAVLGAGGQ
jgi:uncharacterized RDD family membrane protein YckC